ncbi:MAG: amidohydrolase [Gemmatimonadetes bacterium]|nr:amidohydrolase [Gemmatimonadota bacterium]
MIRHALAAALLAAASSSCSRLPTAGGLPTNGSTEFRHVAVIDVATGAVLPDRTVLVSGNRIVSIASGEQASAAGTVIDGRGKFLMPGMWDMHMHVATLPDSTTSLNARARSTYFPRLLAAGVTGIRDMGSWLDSIVELRREVRTGATLGPRMVVAGSLLDGKSPWSPPTPHAWIVETPAQAKFAVDSLARAGVDFIKVHDLLARDVFFAAVAAARTHGLPLVGHMRPNVPVTEAVAAGQRGIEHVAIELAAGCTSNDTGRANAFYGAWIKGGWPAYVRETRQLWADREPARCAAMFAGLRDAGVGFTPTLVLRMQDSSLMSVAERSELTPSAANQCAGTLNDWGALADSLRQASYETAFDIVRAAHAAGVRILAGTDGPMGCLAPGRSLQRELVALTRAGLSPLEAIQSATIEPARFMGFADSLGTVEAHKVADLVLLDANPLLSLSALVRPAGVMANGRWLSREELEKRVRGSSEPHSTTLQLSNTTPRNHR